MRYKTEFRTFPLQSILWARLSLPASWGHAPKVEAYTQEKIRQFNKQLNFASFLNMIYPCWVLLYLTRCFQVSGTAEKAITLFHDILLTCIRLAQKQLAAGAGGIKSADFTVNQKRLKLFWRGFTGSWFSLSSMNWKRLWATSPSGATRKRHFQG